MKHKAGDKVQVHTLDWFREHCGFNSCCEFSRFGSGEVIALEMLNEAGKTVTIKSVDDEGFYHIAEFGYSWYDWMFEDKGVVMNETNWEHFQGKIEEEMRAIITNEGRSSLCRLCLAKKECDAAIEKPCLSCFMDWAVKPYQPEIKRHTMQEIADYMHVYVAKDKSGTVYCYHGKPKINIDSDIWDCDYSYYMLITDIVSDADTHDWETLVKPEDK